MFSSRRLLHASACLLLLAPLVLRAQSPFVDGSVDSPGSGPVVAAAAAASSTQAQPRALDARWLDLTEFSESQRYRNNFDTNGATIFKAGQQRTVISGRILLDRQANYFIGFRASSGNYFNWSYADYIGHDFLYYAGASLGKFTPGQYGDFFAALAADPGGTAHDFSAKGWRLNMRDLYLSASPVKQATVEFGSIPIERGFNSEITSFDDDGYMAGERVRLHLPSALHVDEVSVTTGYLGDVTNPDFAGRGERLAQNNYIQVAGKTLIAKRVGLSADFTKLNDTHTLREAVFLKLDHAALPGELHLDLYQRVNDVVLQGATIAHGNGFAAYASKKAGRFSGDMGYASVEPGYGVYTDSRFLTVVGDSLNGDTYNTGKRFFTHSSIRLGAGVSIFGFFTHTTSGTDYTYNRQGFNAGMKFDLKTLINSGKQIL